MKFFDDVLDKHGRFFFLNRQKERTFELQGLVVVLVGGEIHHRTLNGFQMAVSSLKMDYFKVL